MLTGSPETAKAAGSITNNLPRTLLLLAGLAGCIWFYRSAQQDQAQQQKAAENAEIQDCWRKRYTSENAAPDQAQTAKCSALAWAYVRKHGTEPY